MQSFGVVATIEVVATLFIGFAILDFVKKADLSYDWVAAFNHQFDGTSKRPGTLVGLLRQLNLHIQCQQEV